MKLSLPKAALLRSGALIAPLLALLLTLVPASAVAAF